MPSLIYIVDDDASFRTAVERRLKLAGYEVEKHSSAQTLLDRLQGSEVPGCVLLDVRMPGLNGLELQSRLIELHFERGLSYKEIALEVHVTPRTVLQVTKGYAELRQVLEPRVPDSVIARPKLAIRCGTAAGIARENLYSASLDGLQAADVPRVWLK